MTAAPPATAVAPELASLAELSPANFGMVMATGIVAIAADALGLAVLARVLFWLSAGAYVVLWALSLARLARHPRRFFGDMTDHLRGPGYFTTIAASSVLGSECVLLAGNDAAATTLWWIALALWVGLIYTVFTALTIKADKPRLDAGISGGWLLAVVATQSIAVLAALLAPRMTAAHRLEINFVALSMWLWGGMLYIWMISLIFYRYTFFPFAPSDLAPPYWINMGAMAISTLAGALLVANAPGAPFLASLLPFLKGFTVFYWATGTWWIPMLVALAVWRYVLGRVPFRYDPLYWGAVFPLGMYTAAPHELALAMGFGFLAFLPPVLLVVALLAWSATLVGLLRHLARVARSRFGTAP